VLVTVRDRNGVVEQSASIVPPTGDGALSLLPVALLGSLAASYVTPPANRGGSANEALA
jgi:hypothetical protein